MWLRYLYPTPKLDVRAAVFRGDELLLVREAGDGRWSLPGGWVDLREFLGEAATREVRESPGTRFAPSSSSPSRTSTDAETDGRCESTCSDSSFNASSSRRQRDPSGEPRRRRRSSSQRVARLGYLRDAVRPLRWSASSRTIANRIALQTSTELTPRGFCSVKAETHHSLASARAPLDLSIQPSMTGEAPEDGWGVAKRSSEWRSARRRALAGRGVRHRSSVRAHRSACRRERDRASLEGVRPPARGGQRDTRHRVLRALPGRPAAPSRETLRPPTRALWRLRLGLRP